MRLRSVRRKINQKFERGVAIVKGRFRSDKKSFSYAQGGQASMAKQRRDWDEGVHVRSIVASYRAPMEQLMTLTEEQYRASEDSLLRHRNVHAIFTDFGLVVGGPSMDC